MSAMLDLVIGLVLVFLAFAAVVSGINEWLAQWWGRRGEYLRLGLQRLIGDGAIYNRVLHHPLIGSLYRERAAQGKPPSYVDSRSFAMALADVMLARARVSGADNSREPHPPLTIASLRAALRTPALAASPVAFTLGPIVERAGDDLGAALRGIENWFDSGMDRVSGWYKTRTRWMLFWIGLVLAALCNVDAIEIAGTLSRSAALRSAMAQTGAAAGESGQIGDVKLADLAERAPTPAEWQSMRPLLERAHGRSDTLPIGYRCLGVVLDAPVSQPGAGPQAEGSRSVWRACIDEARHTWRTGSPANGLLKLLGWALTAMAGAMGAGFWFGLLSKTANMRGAGPKPRTDRTAQT